MACSPTHRRAALLTADLVLELGRCATAQVAAAIVNAALLTADLVLELGRRARRQAVVIPTRGDTSGNTARGQSLSTLENAPHKPGANPA